MDGMKTQTKRLAADLLQLCQESNDEGMSPLRIFEVFATFTTMLAQSLEESKQGSTETSLLVRDAGRPNGWIG